MFIQKKEMIIYTTLMFWFKQTLTLSDSGGELNLYHLMLCNVLQILLGNITGILQKETDII